MKTKSTLTALLLFGAPCLYAAANAAIGPLYLTPHALSSNSNFPAPPANGSQEDRRELNEILRIQSTRTHQDCARAQSEANPSLKSFFGPPYGPLSATEVQAWDPFFAKVARDTRYFVKQEKDLWKRPRPFTENPRIKPCLPLENSPAYPSGHATQARVFADILGMIDPSRKLQFNARASQIAEDRVLGGAHHPSDIQAGKQLGAEIFNALQESASFEQDLEKLKSKKKR